METSALLRAYSTLRSEEAFRELVHRHVNLVYSAALRQTAGDTHRAEDISQAVFAQLARDAGRLADHPALSGWLYTTTHHLSAKAIRSETRRKAREQEAHTMNEILGDSDAVDLAEIRGVLDDAMHCLSKKRRTALVLHFFDRRPIAEVGAKLGLTESGARKNIERGLDELRDVLARRGITSSSAAVGGFLGSQAIHAAPAGLAAAVSSFVLAPVSTASSAVGLFQLMSTTKITTAVLGIIALAGIGAAVVQLHDNDRMKSEIANLSRQNQEIPRLRGEVQQLKKSAESDAATLRDQMDNLTMQLTAAAAVKPAATSAPLGPSTAPQDVPAGTLALGLIPADQWQNAGRATASTAMMTELWAQRGSDLDQLAASFTIAADARAFADTVFAGLPEAVRLEYGTFERWAARQMLSSTQFAGAVVIDETAQGPDDSSLRVRWEYTDGRVRDNTWQFHRSTDGTWQRILPRAMLEKAAGR